MTTIWIYWPNASTDNTGAWFEAKKQKGEYVYTNNWISEKALSSGKSVQHNSPDAGVVHDGNLRKVKNTGVAKKAGDYVTDIVAQKKKQAPKRGTAVNYYIALVSGYENRLLEYSELDFEELKVELQFPSVEPVYVPGYGILNKKLDVKSSAGYKLSDMVIWKFKDHSKFKKKSQRDSLALSLASKLQEYDYARFFIDPYADEREDENADSGVNFLQTIKEGRDTYYVYVIDAESG